MKPLTPSTPHRSLPKISLIPSEQPFTHPPRSPVRTAGNIPPAIMSIVASGQALTVGNPRGPNTFQIQVDDSVDVTQMKIAIHGPSAPEIWTNNRGDGLLEVSYRIGLVGRYLLTITYHGTSIQGSPYTLIIR